MHKFHLNADLEAVWLRLAGEFKADVTESYGAPFVQENTQVKILPSAPENEESEH